MLLTDSFRNLGNQGRFWNELSMTILSIPRDYTLCTNSEEVKKELLARFGHTKYYRFYREEVAVMPKDK